MTQLDWNEQLFEMIGRCRSNSKSKVAAIVTRCQMIVSNNPDRIINQRPLQFQSLSQTSLELLPISQIEVIDFTLKTAEGELVFRRLPQRY